MCVIDYQKHSCCSLRGQEIRRNACEYYEAAVKPVGFGFVGDNMAEWIRQKMVLVKKCKSISREVEVEIDDKCELCVQRDEWRRNMNAASSSGGR
jgi:hypothetical protein